MADNLTPDYTTQEMHEKYESKGLLRQWKDFLDAGKNTTLRTAAFDKQKHICPRCGQPIASIGVGCIAHHTTYDNICTSAAAKIMQPVPTSLRPHRNLLLADCGKCKVENSAAFIRCRNAIVMLHQSCHAQVHEKCS